MKLCCRRPSVACNNAHVRTVSPRPLLGRRNATRAGFAAAGADTEPRSGRNAPALPRSPSPNVSCSCRSRGRTPLTPSLLPHRPVAQSATTADRFQVQGPSGGGIVASGCSAGVGYMPFQRCSLPRGRQTDSRSAAMICGPAGCWFFPVGQACPSRAISFHRLRASRTAPPGSARDVRAPRSGGHPNSKTWRAIKTSQLEAPLPTRSGRSG
jgi:hypothetical protein